MILFYGLVTGIFFGALLQRGGVLRYDKQMGAMRLIDMTIVKFMLSAIAVAMVGYYALEGMGLIAFSVKPTILGSNIIGGLIFGLGWGLLGYCPGTAMGAMGEGRWDALWGILGMLVGAAVFAEAYPLLASSTYAWGNFGKVTLPQMLGINSWFVVVGFGVIVIMLSWFFKRKRL